MFTYTSKLTTKSSDPSVAGFNVPHATNMFCQLSLCDCVGQQDELYWHTVDQSLCMHASLIDDALCDSIWSCEKGSGHVRLQNLG